MSLSLSIKNIPTVRYSYILIYMMRKQIKFSNKCQSYTIEQNLPNRIMYICIFTFSALSFYQKHTYLKILLHTYSQYTVTRMLRGE